MNARRIFCRFLFALESACGCSGWSGVSGCLLVFQFVWTLCWWLCWVFSNVQFAYASLCNSIIWIGMCVLWVGCRLWIIMHTIRIHMHRNLVFTSVLTLHKWRLVFYQLLGFVSSHHMLVYLTSAC
jgi:hypothetical protein